MPDEWPIDLSPVTGSIGVSVALPAADGGRRLAAIAADFFLAPDVRLTEQERALMTAMLHGLVDHVADELRARLDPASALACAAGAAELVGDLTAAGLIQDEALVAVLLRRADVQRLALGAPGGRSRLQRWTADADADIAAAAMALVAARGRGRDRFGRAALDLGDLPIGLAQRLVQVVAAALGRRCTVPSDHAVASAAADLLRARSPSPRLADLESALAAELGAEGRREPGLVVALASDGDVPLLAAILAIEGGILPDEAWRCLLGGGEQVALLLRLGGLARPEVAALLAHAGPALGIGDPVKGIERFDVLTEAEVAGARLELSLPTAYRQARRLLDRHG